MLKHLLTLVALIGLCTSATAQQIGARKALSFKGYDNPLPKKEMVQGTHDYSNMGMSIDELAKILPESDKYGGFGTADQTQEGTTYTVGMYIPKAYAGKQIERLKFFIDGASKIENLTIWANQARLSTISGAKVRTTVENPVDLKDGYNDVAFTKAYTIPAGGAWVGLYFTVKDPSCGYPLLISDESGHEGSFWFKSSKPNQSWVNLSDDYTLVLYATLSGEFPSNAATLSSEVLGTTYSVKGKQGYIHTKVTNPGENSIYKINYTVTDATTSKVTECDPIVFGEKQDVKTFNSYEVSFPIPAEENPGDYKKIIKITKINNKENEATTLTEGSVNFLVRSKLYNRNVVLEEATATGCAPCARSHAAMDLLDNRFGNRVIGIAAHVSGVNYWDPMYCADYTSLTSQASGIPTGWVNRTKVNDVYFGNNNTIGGIVDYVKAEFDKLPEGKVECKAYWDSEEKTITAKADVEFCVNKDVSPYALAYVLMGEALRDPNGPKAGQSPESYWYQNDAYYGYNQFANEKYMHKWETRDDIYEWIVSDGGQQYKQYLAKDVEYNHVALKAISVSQGVTGSIASPIVADQQQSHSVVFSIPNGIVSSEKSGSCNLLQDKSNLYVVAMIIDRANNNEIINAVKTKVMSWTDGIENVSSDSNSNATEVARYTVDGRQISAPVKGLNIIKMSNGKTVKVMIK